MQICWPNEVSDGKTAPDITAPPDLSIAVAGSHVNYAPVKWSSFGKRHYFTIAMVGNVGFRGRMVCKSGCIADTSTRQAGNVWLLVSTDLSWPEWHSAFGLGYVSWA